MLKLLLDEHLSPRLAQQFRAKWPDASIDSALTLEQGRLAGAPDDALLTEAAAGGWTLVTYDQATIVPLLKNWGEQGIEHGGVILVDGHTIAPSNIGSLLGALGTLWKLRKDDDWTNKVVYLCR